MAAMKKIILTSLLFTALLTGCIQTPAPDVPKRVAILYNVENTGNVIATDQDTITVEVVKLLADRVNIRFIDDRILQTQPDAIVMTYRSQFEGEDETIVSTNIGIDDFQGFKGMKLFIDVPQEGENIQDNDFYGGTNNFSFIFSGTYNSKNITYKSDPVFEKDFSFNSNIELTNENETLLVRITFDLQNILVNPENGQIIDPENPDNHSKIDSLMQEAISIEASAADLL